VTSLVAEWRKGVGVFPCLWKALVGNRDTWAGAQRSRPAGVRTPRASNSRAIAANVVLPARRISAITARVVALALLASGLGLPGFAGALRPSGTLCQI